MKLPQLPCKTNKCILYPSCINTQHIDCTDLYNIIAKVVDDLETHRMLLKHLKEVFPNAHSVTDPLIQEYYLVGIV